MKHKTIEKVNVLPAEEARLLSGKDIMLHRILNVVYRRIEIAATGAIEVGVVDYCIATGFLALTNLVDLVM